MMSNPARHPLRRPLIGAALSMLVSAALLIWAETRHADAELQLRQAHARLAQARSRHQALRETASATIAAEKTLASLRAAGALTPPSCQAWQTHLEAIAEASPANRFEWEIQPASGAAEPGFITCALQLRGNFAHEGHLLAALKRPAGHVEGLFRPRHCLLARASEEGAPAGLSVACEIEWSALQLPAATP